MSWLRHAVALFGWLRPLLRIMQGEVLFLSELVFKKARAFKYVFDIRNHLRVTTRVRDRVTVIEPKLVGMLAHDILDPAGFTLPVRFGPGPADCWYVPEPSCA